MFKSDNLSLAQFVGTDSEVPVNVAGAIAKQIKKERENKGMTLQKNWDFYQGFQSGYFVQRVNEANSSYEQRIAKAVIVNFARLIVDTNTKFLYSRTEKIGRQFGDEDKTRKRLKHINELVNIDKLQLDSKRQACIFGESIIRLVPTDEFTGEIIAGNKATSSTYPHPIHLDPQCTYILTDPLDKIIGVVIESEYMDYVKDQRVETVELVVEDSRWYWEDDELIKSELNSYSLDEEFVLQINNELRRDDLTNTLVLQTKLNEAMSDVAFFLERHGRPQLVSEVDLSNVEMGSGKVWEIKGSDEDKKVMDKLFFLTWDGHMEEALSFIKKLEGQILKLSDVAMIATGDIESTGQLRTGAALVTSHGPTIKLTQESKLIWGVNEKKLNKAIAKLDAKLHGQAFQVRFPEYDFRIDFPRDAGVAGEELVNAEVRAMQLNSHAITFDESIAEDHSWMTPEERKAYREEIIADSKDIADALRVFESIQSDSGSKPKDSSQKKSNEQSGQSA